MRDEKFVFKILIKREPDAWVARCLELNLVAVAETAAQVESDIIDVILSHVHYALEHDNLEHLFHPAPPHVWKEFFNCTDREEATYRDRRVESPDDRSVSFIPVIQADKCFYRMPVHA